MKRKCFLKIYKILVLLFVLSLISCPNNVSKAPIPKQASLMYFSILGTPVLSNELTVRVNSINIERTDIEFLFLEKDAPLDFICSEEFPIRLTANSTKDLTFTIPATNKYLQFDYKISIKCTNKEALSLKKLTIFGRSFSHRKVFIPHDKNEITKSDIVLEFHQTDAPREFQIKFENPHFKTDEYRRYLTIRTAETDRYESWEADISVFKEKPSHKQKTVEDCFTALEASTWWNEVVIDDDIVLPKTVAGFEGSIVEWNSHNNAYLSNDGKITRGLKDRFTEIDVHIAWNGQHRYSVFSTVIARLKNITSVKQTSPFPTTTMFNFEQERILLISKNNFLMEKYLIKAIEPHKKEIRLKLLEVSDGKDGLIPLNEVKDTSGGEQIIKALFGESYQNMRKADIIFWEDLKNYALNYWSEALNFDEPPSDEDIFEMLITNGIYFGINLKFTGSINEFKLLSDADRTCIIKEMLDMMKNYTLKCGDIDKNITDKDFLDFLLEEQKAGFEYKIMQRGKEKTYSYKLEKTGDINLWPNGYAFENEAIYQVNKKWQEQNGIFALKQSSSQNLMLILEINYIRKNGQYIGSLIYDNSTSTFPAPHYQFQGVLNNENFSLFDAGYAAHITGEIKNSGNGKLAVDIRQINSEFDEKGGKYILDFFGEMIN